MKRLVLLLTLTGILSVPFEGFAKSPKRTTATIKYENGDKYVGEITKYPIKYIRLPILPIRFVAKNNKIRNGKGVMYYANGNSFDGSWNNDSPSYGTYQYANGDYFKGSLKNNYLFKGQLVFAHKGSVKFGDKLWEYPANSSFDGELEGRSPLSGSFDCPLASTTGDKFTGTIMSEKLYKGTLLFANGDTFEGSFIQSAPSFGKYRYAKTTEIAGTTYKWIVPAGCTFNGDVQTFTGTVDIGITNETGDKFVGELHNGMPDEGTMTFANGTTETGKWHDGMSPSAYKAEQEKKEKERQIYDRKCLSAFESYINNHIAKEQKENIWNTCFKSIVCGNFWNQDNKELVHGVSIKLAQLYIGKRVTYSDTGETIYVCTAINHDASSAPYIEMTLKPEQGGATKTLYLTRVRISKSPELSSLLPINYPYPNTLPHVYYRCEAVESKGSESSFYDSLICLVSDDARDAAAQAKDYWTRRFGQNFGEAVFNRKAKLGMSIEMVQIIEKSEGRMSRHVESGREIIVLTYGGTYNNFFGSFSKMRTYTFVNNRLTEYTE